MSSLFALLTLTFAALQGSSRTSEGAPRFDPVQRFDPAQDVGIDQKLGAQVPLDLPFRDETGRNVALRELVRERPVVLTLVYYECPMLCSLVLDDVVRAMRGTTLELGLDYDVVTVSIDPREDHALAAAKKGRYVEAFDADATERERSAWHFLVGDQSAIDALAAAVGFRYVYDEQVDEFAHAAGLMVLTPDGVVSRYLYGVDYRPKDLRLALVEAGDGRVGSLADQVLMLCFHYDPTTGKYGFAVISALRVLGVLTVLAIGVFVVRSLLRERRARASEVCP
jgi:protein SCO1/2